MSLCKLCGEPMPPGEKMFYYHGYSGKCPKPPLSEQVQLDQAGNPKLEMTLLERKAIEVLNNIKAAVDGELIQLPVEMQMGIDVVLAMATVRRVGVK
jgi:hypothetical protein